MAPHGDHGNGHDHDHDHDHGPIQEVDDTRLGYYEALTYELRDYVVETGLTTADAIRKAFEAIDSKGIHLGARLVAKAWTEPDFKDWLLRDAKPAAASIGIPLTEADLIVVENTPAVHNVIVCTLCSCYPRSLLGQPPDWYVSKAYRSRTVREPRVVLREFGLEIADDVTLRVHDSNADMRYMVLPMRPDGSEALSVTALEALVTRDHLVGTAVPTTPR